MIVYNEIITLVTQMELWAKKDDKKILIAKVGKDLPTKFILSDDAYDSIYALGEGSIDVIGYSLILKEDKEDDNS